MMMFFFKWLLVLGLLGIGALFLLTGLGIEAPVIKYQGFEGQRVPAGVVLIAAGIALAVLWRVSSTTSIEETLPDGTHRKRVVIAKGTLKYVRDLVLYCRKKSKGKHGA
jgi:hypothetical protein